MKTKAILFFAYISKSNWYSNKIPIAKILVLTRNVSTASCCPDWIACFQFSSTLNTEVIYFLFRLHIFGFGKDYTFCCSLKIQTF
jgi:hypothetical protein